MREAIIRQLRCARQNPTYLFISHDLAVVRHMANRIGVLYLGRLAEVTPGKVLFRNPRHPYIRMLLTENEAIVACHGVEERRIRPVLRL